MPVHPRVTPSIKFAGTHLYTWVERGTVRVKCLSQEHNTMSQARTRTRPLDTKSSAQTMRPPRLPFMNAISGINTSLGNQPSWSTLLGLLVVTFYFCTENKALPGYWSRPSSPEYIFCLDCFSSVEKPSFDRLM